ncbi:MAG: hypothetical protein ACI3ZK_02230 [Candidatus Cryptobacteroides sp.]
MAALIQNTEGYEKENKIARLLMALAMSRSMPAEVKTKESEARKEICKILGVQDHFKGTAEKGGGKSGLGELANVEFKSSYIMRNDGKGADIDFQGRWQVFDAIRIEVTPSEFEIVKLYKDNTWEEGVAYVRDGEETVPMTRIEQERRLMKLR